MIVFEPVILDQSFDVLSSELGKLRELAKKTTEIFEYLPDYVFSLDAIETRHCKLKVRVCNASKLPVQIVAGSRDQFACQDRASARQQTEKFQEQPGRNEFKQIPNAASLSRRHVLKLARRFESGQLTLLGMNRGVYS